PGLRGRDRTGQSYCGFPPWPSWRKRSSAALSSPGSHQCGARLSRASSADPAGSKDGSLDVLPHRARWYKMTRMPTHWRRLTTLRRPFSPPRSLPPAHGSPISSEAADPTASYLADLLADTREELTRADTKAALILAATGVAIGALLAGLFGGKWTPFDLDSKIQWLWWLGVASTALGVFSIAAAVYPHIRRHGAVHPGVPAYYGDVVAYENIDTFRHAIEKAPKPKDRLIDQTFVVSRIVQRKYILLRRGLRCFLLAIVACIAAVMINIPLGR